MENNSVEPRVDNNSGPSEAPELPVEGYPLCPVCQKPLLARNKVIIGVMTIPSVEIGGIRRPALLHQRCASSVLSTEAILSTGKTIGGREKMMYLRVQRMIAAERERRIVKLRAAIGAGWSAILLTKAVAAAEADLKAPEPLMEAVHDQTLAGDHTT